ncbi:MAG: hypothetical protein J0H75_11535, partial [Rhizobiales bacterium]|nr:hypothetical protein [Hyphomicrobiales bacterium]
AVPQAADMALTHRRGSSGPTDAARRSSPSLSLISTRVTGSSSIQLGAAALATSPNGSRA